MDIDPNYATPGFRASDPGSKPYESACRLCDLADDDRCMDAPCLSDNRPDGRRVIMKAIEPSEVTK